MSKKFCVYCGTELGLDDRFCHGCGAKSSENTKRSLHSQQYVDEEQYEAEVERKTPEKYYTRRKKNLSPGTKKAIILIPIILGVIAMPLVAVSIIGSIRSPLGTLTYEVPDSAALDIELIISNSVGKSHPYACINVHFTNTRGNAFD